MKGLTVHELRLMLAELDPNEKVGYDDSSGNGGIISATRAELIQDAHDPECDCGCVSIVIV